MWPNYKRHAMATMGWPAQSKMKGFFVLIDNFKKSSNVPFLKILVGPSNAKSKRNWLEVFGLGVPVEGTKNGVFCPLWSILRGRLIQRVLPKHSITLGIAELGQKIRLSICE